MANIILVEVETPNGFDTKFLFPGLMSHEGFSATGPSTWWYHYDLMTDGDTAPGGVFGKHFEIFDNLHTATGVGTYDIQGSMYQWSVRDTADDSHATLALLQSLITTETSGSHPHNIYIPSISWVTPDSLISSAKEQVPGIYMFVRGNVGNDTLRGSYWHDELRGEEGRDSLLAGDGDDTLNGGAGADKMIGGPGDDRFYVDTRKDQIIEANGEGWDTVFTTLDYTLSKNLESVAASGTRNFHLTGNAAANGVEGSSGADTLKGLGADDVLSGGVGKDVLYGGTGKDSFFFLTNPTLDKPDTIKDFNHRDDTIKVSQTAFAGLFPTFISGTNFPLPADLFHASKSGQAHDPSDRILYDTTDGRLYFDSDGTGATARVQFATLTGHPHITADDIWVL